ncbi:hypothetical protein T492DRAFT_1036820 [Pavlovales sp. CCMP2436]|nr:hypothetical protein T492DRAFT_1036820 [Pavlovales sp. CCMP2436]
MVKSPQIVFPGGRLYFWRRDGLRVIGESHKGDPILRLEYRGSRAIRRENFELEAELLSKLHTGNA